MKIKTQNLIKLIEKYHLDESTQPTTWDIIQKNIVINFISKNNDMVGNVKYKSEIDGFKKISIFDTTQLIKLIKIFKSADIDLVIESNNLYVNDDIYDIKYKLADSTLIPKCPEVIVPDKFDISFTLIEKDIKNILSAYNTLKEDTVKFTMEQSIEKGDLCKITFGASNDYSNKVSYNINCKNNIGFSFNYGVDFGSELFTKIISNNTDSLINVYITSEGLMYIHCVNDDFESNYFLLKKSEI